MKAKIKFLKSACGSPYRLPFLSGMIAEVEPKLAVSLIEAGIAEAMATKQVTETAILKPKKVVQQKKAKK